MKLRLRLCITGLFILAAWVYANPPSGYYLQWSDEFNGSALTSGNWNCQTRWRHSAYNTPSAVTVTNGCLVITTYTEGGTNFTGFIDTANKVLKGYGYYEARIQFSNAPGNWSAFWLQSPHMGASTNNNPAAGVEVDIFEHRDVNQGGAQWVNGGDSALHWNGYGAGAQGSSWVSTQLGVGTGFHTYGLLWTSNNYTFYVDGKATWITNYLVSSTPEYIRLTSEVESNSWAGTVPDGGYPDATNSQLKMLVDYVRYYAPIPNLTWDANTGTGGPQDGGGFWLVNSANWWNGSGDVTWSKATPCNAIFGAGGAAGTVSILNAFTMAVLAFDPVASGSYTLSGAGPLTISNGITADTSATLSVPIVLAADQTWSIASNQILTASTGISGSGALTEEGTSGTLVLAGSNTFTNNMTIVSGTLQVDGSVGTNAVTVQAGAVLGGDGVINGPVTLSGSVSPADNNVGTLTTGTETWTNGAVCVFGINNATNSSGWDSLNINGSLNLQSTADNSFTIKLVSLTNSNIPGLAAGFENGVTNVWTLATTSGGIMNFHSAAFVVDAEAFSNMFAGTFSVETNKNSLVVVYTPPPPTAPILNNTVSHNAGTFSLSFSGLSGQIYQVLASTNLALPLTNWMVLAHGTFGSGVIDYTDSMATNARCFYRILSQW